MTASKKTAKGTKKSAKSQSKKGGSRKVGAASQELALKIAPQGPSPELFATLSRELLQHPSLQPFTAKTRSRLLALELIEDEVESKTARPPAPSDRFRATIYDYTNNRALSAEGNLNNRRKLPVPGSSRQPFPTDEEFNEAVTILQKDPGVGPALREKALQPYAPMPPLIESTQPNGRNERTVCLLRDFE